MSKLGPNLTKDVSRPLLNHFENHFVSIYQFLPYRKLNHPNILHPSQDPPIGLGRKVPNLKISSRAAYI